MSADSPQIQELKKRYRASFPEKLATLLSVKEAVSSNNDLELAREELHKLAGSSGMYGYKELAFHCRAAMEHLDNKETDSLLISIDSVIALLEI